MPTPTPSLDEALGAFCDALAIERRSYWAQGDVITGALGLLDLPDHRTRSKARLQLLGQFAAAGHCSKQWVRELAAVAGYFDEGSRDIERSWGWSRAVMRLAHRLGLERQEALRRAQEMSWSIAQMERVGQKLRGTMVKLDTVCGECGFRVLVSCRKHGIESMVGLGLSCPVCRETDRPDIPLGITAVA